MDKPEVEIPDGPPSYQLELEDLVVGDGDEAAKGNIVEVHYVGVSHKSGKDRSPASSLLPQQHITGTRR